MKIVRVRFRNSTLAFDDDRTPVTHHFHSADTGLTIEIRRADRQTFVYGWREHKGVTSYAGLAAAHWAHCPSDFSTYVSGELFRIAEELGVDAHHVWPFVDQLPVFTEAGVDVAEALELAGPIKDLLARGASATEVMNSLNVDKALIEFAIGTELPPARSLLLALDDDNVTNW